jgi:hypothetical protein
MSLHQKAYLEKNLYHDRYPGQIYGGEMIRHREEITVSTHMLPANQQFRVIELWKYYWLRRVVFWAKVASAPELAQELALQLAVVSAVCIRWVEVHMFLHIPTMSGDFLLCHFPKEGIWGGGLEEA